MRTATKPATIIATTAIALIGAASATAGPGAPAHPPVRSDAGASATRYFVDCNAGSDSSSGLSPDHAWRSLARVNAVALGPGDQILFRRGTHCDGVLAPQGSGAPGAPIMASAYGQGPKPQIDGGGAPQAVLLHNVDYWEIRNLDISDLGPIPQPGELRVGISVVLDSGFGTGHHYVVANVDIHDVNSSSTPPPDGNISSTPRTTARSRAGSSSRRPPVTALTMS